MRFKNQIGLCIDKTETTPCTVPFKPPVRQTHTTKANATLRCHTKTDQPIYTRVEVGTIAHTDKEATRKRRRENTDENRTIYEHGEAKLHCPQESRRKVEVGQPIQMVPSNRWKRWRWAVAARLQTTVPFGTGSHQSTMHWTGQSVSKSIDW